MAGSNRSVVLLALTGVAGLLLLIAADRFARPELIGPGLLLFAAGIFAAGADAIIRRRTVERSRETTAVQVFTGTAARLMGVGMLILACAIGVAGISFLLGTEARVYDFLLRRPGFALVPAGLLFGVMGSARVLGARDWRTPARILATLPERFGGVLALLFGLALAGIGVFELLAPPAFDELVQSLLAPLQDAPR